MSSKDIKPIARKSNIVVQDYVNEILIYDLAENKAFSLNETSALIWQLCDGNKPVSEIAGDLSDRFNSPISEDFVWLALEQFKKDNLLENEEEVSTAFGGLSRREIIRKIGLTSLIALPLVSSLIAPTAINAASACVVVPPGTAGRLNPNSNCGAPANPATGSANCTACCCRAPNANPTAQTICGAPNANTCV